MCGIFGIVVKAPDLIPAHKLHEITNNLFELSESRGKEASGIACILGDTITVYKEPLPSRKFIRKEKYQQFFEEIAESQSEAFDSPMNLPLAIIGHSRLATNGLHTKNRNNQPVVTSGVVGVHNGIVVNDGLLLKRAIKEEPEFDVDTEAVLRLIAMRYWENGSLEQAFRETYRRIKGSASLAAIATQEPTLMLATNTGSLYMGRIGNGKVLAFASEEYIVRHVMSRMGPAESEGNGVVRVKPGSGYRIDLLSRSTSQRSGKHEGS